MTRTLLNLSLSFALVAMGLFPGVYKAFADEHLVVAADVVDRETLKNFVLGARSRLESVQDEGELDAILESFRTDEEWKQGSIYIFITGYDGTSFFHGAIPEREGVNVIDQEDSNGVKVVQQNIAAAQAGGGFTRKRYRPSGVAGNVTGTGSSMPRPSGG